MRVLATWLCRMTASLWKSCSTTTFSLSLGTYKHKQVIIAASRRLRFLLWLCCLLKLELCSFKRGQKQSRIRYSQPCLSWGHPPAPTGPDLYMNTFDCWKLSRQPITYRKWISELGTCRARWWASRCSSPAAAANGRQLFYYSDPLWAPQTAAHPP